MWRPPPGQGRKGIIQKMSLHCLGKEKKKYSQNQTGTKALFCRVAAVLGLCGPGIPDPVQSGSGKGLLLCCGCRGPAALLRAATLGFDGGEKRLPAHLAQSTKQVLRAAHSWGTMCAGGSCGRGKEVQDLGPVSHLGKTQSNAETGWPAESFSFLCLNPHKAVCRAGQRHKSLPEEKQGVNEVYFRKRLPLAPGLVTQ